MALGKAMESRDSESPCGNPDLTVCQLWASGQVAEVTLDFPLRIKAENEDNSSHLGVT